MSTQIALAPAARRPVPAPRRTADDHAFLPADLEILETPPSPVRMAFILLIAAFVAIALAWSWFGHVEIVAVAPGKIQPTGRVKVIQPLETGKVAAISVENGRAVHAGDVLIEMEDGDARAEATAAAAALASYRAEVLRRGVAIEAARRKAIPAAPAIPWSLDAPEAIRAREDQVLQGDLAQLASALAGFDAQVRQKQIERDRLADTIAAQGELLATLNERVAMKTSLLASASGSRASVIDALETAQTQKTLLTTQKSQRDAAIANLDVLAEERDKAITAFVADNAQKRAAAQRQVEDAEQKLAKAKLKLDHLRLVSPIDGTVFGLSVSTLGQVLTGGQEAMRIVPEDSALEIEGYVANKDIGFVRAGQKAVVKLESFPFTRYGTVSATITRVARDAIPEPDAKQAEATGAPASKAPMFAGSQRTQDLVFPVTLTLDRSAVAADGEVVPLRPGMSVSVEIATGQRRILDFFLSPLAEVGSQAIRER
jgi:hemolysin D